MQARRTRVIVKRPHQYADVGIDCERVDRLPAKLRYAVIAAKLRSDDDHSAPISHS